jgi:hypothetical protein
MLSAALSNNSYNLKVTAVTYCKQGKGVVDVNGKPLEQVEPKALQYKLQEPILLLGKDRFADVDIQIRVKELLRSMQSDSLLPNPCLHTSKNTLINRTRKPSKTS